MSEFYSGITSRDVDELAGPVLRFYGGLLRFQTTDGYVNRGVPTSYAFFKTNLPWHPSLAQVKRCLSVLRRLGRISTHRELRSGIVIKMLASAKYKAKQLELGMVANLEPRRPPNKVKNEPIEGQKRPQKDKYPIESRVVESVVVPSFCVAVGVAVEPPQNQPPPPTLELATPRPSEDWEEARARIFG